jgi:hypothetical protein
VNSLVSVVLQSLNAGTRRTFGIIGKEEETHQTDMLDVQPGDYGRSTSAVSFGENTDRD